MARRSMGLLLGVAVGSLPLVGASATHYLQEPYSPGFLRFPAIVALHVVLGGAWLALASFQFVKLVRARHPGYHRWAGGVARGVIAAFVLHASVAEAWIRVTRRAAPRTGEVKAA